MSENCSRTAKRLTLGLTPLTNPRSNTMSDPLRLGIAGLGTVGVGVVKIVERQAELLARRCGRPIKITAVSARAKGKDRGVDLSPYAWEDDPVALARRPDVDVFV